MKIPSDIVGTQTGPDEQEIDARWLMAYSAGLGETTYPHPLFPVCYEWPVSRPIREIPALKDHYRLLVHAEHDLAIHRAPRAADRLRVAARITAVARKKPGALVVFRFDARDAGGAPVSTTHFTALYRGVEVEGADRGNIDPLPGHGIALPPVATIDVPATAAHVYTECARIWNPIHTDRDYAQAAGLPDIILHGTATLALSVSRAIAAFAFTPRRIRCRFAGMVFMPSTLTVHASRQGDAIAFETRNERGQPVIERGWIG
jgi:acyl dehydratase